MFAPASCCTGRDVAHFHSPPSSRAGEEQLAWAQTFGIQVGMEVHKDDVHGGEWCCDGVAWIRGCQIPAGQGKVHDWRIVESTSNFGIDVGKNDCDCSETRETLHTDVDKHVTKLDGFSDKD